MQLVQDGLRQRDLTAERGVHCVVEKMLVEQPVVADGVEIGLAVDQDAAVPVGHFVVDASGIPSGSAWDSRRRSRAWR